MRRCLPLLLALFLVRCGHEDEARSCYDDEACDAGEYCHGAAPSSGCGGDGEPGTCRSRKAEGEVCSGGWWTTECRDGLICHHGTLPPECRPLSPLGGACRYDDDCAPGPGDPTHADDPVCLVADPEGTEAGACGLAGSVPTGGPCASDRACAAPERCIEERCRGPGVEGEACEGTAPATDERPSCREGLYCDWTDEVCRRWLGAGEHCWSFDDRCEEGLFCYSQEGVCHAPLAEGEVCLDDDRCADGLFCSTRAVCSAPLAEGAACWVGDRCAEGLFCYSREAVCRPPLAEGESCRPNDVCAPGLVCDPDTEACRPGA